MINSNTFTALYSSRSPRDTYRTSKIETIMPVKTPSLVVSKPIYTQSKPVFDNRFDTLSLLGFSTSSSSIKDPSLSIRGLGSSIRTQSSRVSRINSKIRTSNSSYIREVSSSVRTPITSIREPSFSIQGTKSIIRAPSSNTRKLNSSIRVLSSLNDVNSQRIKKETNSSSENLVKSKKSILKNNDFERVDKTKTFSKKLGAGLSQNERDEIVKNIVENFNLENYISQIRSSYVVEIELDKKFI